MIRRKNIGASVLFYLYGLEKISTSSFSFARINVGWTSNPNLIFFWKFSSKTTTTRTSNFSIEIEKFLLSMKTDRNRDKKIWLFKYFPLMNELTFNYNQVFSSMKYSKNIKILRAKFIWTRTTFQWLVSSLLAATMSIFSFVMMKI